MTGTRNPQQDGSIQAMLRDSGLEAATELRSTLERMQALVPEQAPAPRADLAALLAAGSTAQADAPATADALPAESLPAGVSSLAERRRGRKRRMALVGGAVVGAMSLGAGAVAASSQDFRENVGQAFTVIFQPAALPRSLRPPRPRPRISRGSGAGSGNHLPARYDSGGALPGATVPAAKHPGPVPTPPAVGRGGVLPTPGQRPVVPGFPGQNGRNIPAARCRPSVVVPELPPTSSDLP